MGENNAYRGTNGPHKNNNRGSKRKTGGHKQPRKSSVPPKPFASRQPATSGIMDAPKKSSPRKKGGSRKKAKKSKARKPPVRQKPTEAATLARKKADEAPSPKIVCSHPAAPSVTGGAPPESAEESREGKEEGKKPSRRTTVLAVAGTVATVVGAACAVITLLIPPNPAPAPPLNSAPPHAQTGSWTDYSVTPPAREFCSTNSNPAYFASVAREGNFYDARKLLRCGMSPDTENSGETVLMIASGSGSIEVARVLVSMGANPHIENESGDTALVFAAVQGHMDIVEFLTSKGANFVPRKKVLGKDEPPYPSWGIDDGKAEVLRKLSLSRKDPEGFLIIKGFTRNPKRNRMRVNAIGQVVSGGKASPSDLQELLRIEGACVNPSAACGMGSPLVSAASRLDLAAVKILLNMGAGPNAREYLGPREPKGLRMGMTPMIAAAGAETCDEGKEIIPILEHLLMKGGNPNLAVPEEHGKSPLSAAERAGNLLTAEFLRKHGARE